MYRRLLISVVLVLTIAGFFRGNPLFAQYNMKDSLKVHILYPSYAFHIPFGDMKERFGISHSVGAGYSYLTKSRWVIAAEYNFLFGPNVKNLGSVLNGITTSDGFVINNAGTPASLAVTERGMTLLFKTGKLVPLKFHNPNTGILIMAGGGFMQHKIRIDISQNDVPPLRDDYKKGYDRMCNGPALTEFIGYHHLDNEKKLNFMAGLESVQAWTMDRRPYSFAEHIETHEKRFDIIVGVKLAWMVPFYGKDKEYYYY